MSGQYADFLKVAIQCSVVHSLDTFIFFAATLSNIDKR